MLTQEQNDILTQVGPGTPVGNLFRRFWLPVMLADELPEPDCPPVRIRVLGEDLVAFRDTRGEVAFVAEACPHRGASLFFGRNEEAGLRCVYHGWKFDVKGACVDMPSEPADPSTGSGRTFKDKVRVRAYPTREWGGAIWVYMGPTDLEPELPQVEWALVPENHRFLKRWVHDVNYAQAMEGDIDTAHVPFLHRTFGNGVTPEATDWDLAPSLHIRDTDYGFVYAGKRSSRTEPGSFNWRLTQMFLPCASQIPSPRYPRNGHYYIPIDDEHTSVIGYSYRADQPMSPEEIARPANGLALVPRIHPGTLAPLCNRENDFLIDRDKQRSANYTGIGGITEQDMAMTQSMGVIVDRRKEHLATSDMAVIHFRRLLISLARELEAGNEPVAARNGSAYAVRSHDLTSPINDFDELLGAFHDELIARGGLLLVDAAPPQAGS
jgi:phthalate 4,5-dioxygenase oxygenase subunit